MKVSKTFKPFVFPTITICNMRGNDKNRTSASLQLKSDLTTKHRLKQALSRATSLRPIDFDDFSDGMSLITERFENYCLFGSNGQKCPSTHWKSLGFGRRCVVFNADGNLTQSDIGRTGGLQLMLYINSDQHLSSTQSEDSANYPMDGEILVSVHQPKTMPNLWNNVFYLQLGFVHEIQLARTIKTRVRNCSNSYPSVEIPGDYVYNLCLFFCNLEKVYSKCGDIQPRFREFLGYDILPKLELPGVNTTLCLEETTPQSSFADMILKCNCHKACNSTSFTSSKFSNSWFSHEKITRIEAILKKEAGLNFTESAIRRNFTLLNIFYNSYETTVEKEELTFQLQNLCSNIGGMMGLFCGASAFSVVELAFVTVIFVLDLPRRVWRKCCKRYKISQDS